MLLHAAQLDAQPAAESRPSGRRRSRCRSGGQPATASAAAFAATSAAAAPAAPAAEWLRRRTHSRLKLPASQPESGGASIKTEDVASTEAGKQSLRTGNVPPLLQEIMDVEHLWQYTDAELARINQPLSAFASGSSSSSSSSSATSSGANHGQSPQQQPQPQLTNPLLASAGLSSNGENANPDLIAHLCNVADHRLYKIVKWCKSLPLFKNISVSGRRMEFVSVPRN